MKQRMGQFFLCFQQSVLIFESTYSFRQRDDASHRDFIVNLLHGFVVRTPPPYALHSSDVMHT